MRLRWALAAVPLVAVLGLLGAGAFNPDGGWLLRSYTLYEIFGAPGEVALLLTPVLAVGFLGYEIVRARRG